MVTRNTLITVRKARDSDADALVTVYAHAWRLAYTGIIPPMHLERAILRRDTRWWKNAIKSEPHLLVLEVDGSVVGYATCGMSRSAPRGTGEIYELYLTPVYQGVGLGEHLFEACRNVLDGLGLPRMIVWALSDNEAAAEFYRNRGGRATARTQERFGQTLVEKIGFSW